MRLDVYLQPSTRKDKKFMVTVFKPDGRRRTVHFGGFNVKKNEFYEDYTIHKDRERYKRYLQRHRDKEDWTISGVFSAGFWSRWLLWNQPGLQKSITDLSKRFPSIKIIRGKPRS
jgi:hypothetical protein